MGLLEDSTRWAEKLTPELAEFLTDNYSKNQKLLIALAKHGQLDPQTPQGVKIRALIQKGNATIRAAFAGRDDLTKDEEENILTDTSAAVRAAWVTPSREITPEKRDRLNDEYRPQVALALCSNPNTPADETGKTVAWGLLALAGTARATETLTSAIWQKALKAPDEEKLAVAKLIKTAPQYKLAVEGAEPLNMLADMADRLLYPTWRDEEKTTGGLTLGFVLMMAGDGVNKANIITKKGGMLARNGMEDSEQEILDWAKNWQEAVASIEDYQKTQDADLDAERESQKRYARESRNMTEEQILIHFGSDADALAGRWREIDAITNVIEGRKAVEALDPKVLENGKGVLGWDEMLVIFHGPYPLYQRIEALTACINAGKTLTVEAIAEGRNEGLLRRAIAAADDKQAVSAIEDLLKVPETGYLRGGDILWAAGELERRLGEGAADIVKKYTKDYAARPGSMLRHDGGGGLREEAYKLLPLGLTESTYDYYPHWPWAVNEELLNIAMRLCEEGYAAANAFQAIEAATGAAKEITVLEVESIVREMLGAPARVRKMDKTPAPAGGEERIQTTLF